MMGGRKFFLQYPVLLHFHSHRTYHLESHAAPYVRWKNMANAHKCVLFSFRTGTKPESVYHPRRKMNVRRARRDESIKLYCFMMFTIISRCLVSILPAVVPSTRSSVGLGVGKQPRILGSFWDFCARNFGSSLLSFEWVRRALGMA